MKNRATGLKIRRDHMHPNHSWRQESAWKWVWFCWNDIIRTNKHKSLVSSLTLMMSKGQFFMYFTVLYFTVFCRVSNSPSLSADVPALLWPLWVSVRSQPNPRGSVGCKDERSRDQIFLQYYYYCCILLSFCFNYLIYLFHSSLRWFWYLFLFVNKWILIKK